MFGAVCTVSRRLAIAVGHPVTDSDAVGMQTTINYISRVPACRRELGLGRTHMKTRSKEGARCSPYLNARRQKD